MAVRTSFVVQAFEHVGGKLVATTRNGAANESSALRRAEAIATTLPGAAALKVASGERGEITTILGAFGDVPDDFSDGLAGG